MVFDATTSSDLLDAPGHPVPVQPRVVSVHTPSCHLPVPRSHPTSSDTPPRPQHLDPNCVKLTDWSATDAGWRGRARLDRLYSCCRRCWTVGGLPGTWQDGKEGRLGKSSLVLVLLAILRRRRCTRHLAPRTSLEPHSSHASTPIRLIMAFERDEMVLVTGGRMGAERGLQRE